MSEGGWFACRYEGTIGTSVISSHGSREDALAAVRALHKQRSGSEEGWEAFYRVESREERRR